jgi:hypothetical protein
MDQLDAVGIDHREEGWIGKETLRLVLLDAQCSHQTGALG